MDKKCFAYLDLLGFSDYTLLDEKGALSLLQNYQFILFEKVLEKIKTGKYPYSDKTLKGLADNSGLDSFQFFIPFSDSIFLTSEKPDLFIKQLSHFLFDAFNTTSHTYKKGKLGFDIPKVNLHEFRYNPTKKRFEGKQIEEYWFPVLFRGGISYGESIFHLEMKAIENYRDVSFPNLSGKTIVEGIKLEKTGKGPRLFCNEDFKNSISPENQYLILPLRKCGLYEILWPMIIYKNCNSCEIEIYELHKLFDPALILWKAFNHLEVGAHYYKFLKLIIFSTLKYFEYRDCSEIAVEYIRKMLKEKDIEEKEKDLLESEYI